MRGQHNLCIYLYVDPLSFYYYSQHQGKFIFLFFYFTYHYYLNKGEAQEKLYITNRDKIFMEERDVDIRVYLFWRKTRFWKIFFYFLLFEFFIKVQLMETTISIDGKRGCKVEYNFCLSKWKLLSESSLCFHILFPHTCSSLHEFWVYLIFCKNSMTKQNSTKVRDKILYIC